MIVLSFDDITQRLDGSIPGEIYSSLIVILIMAIFALIVFFVARKTDPLKKPKGIMLVAELFVGFVDDFVEENMGNKFKKISPYIGFVCMYIFVSFIIGLVGLPSPMTYLVVPLLLSLTTFVAIHTVSIMCTRWGYFKRYISPFALFLPINLLSMWAPLLSLAFRLFGNALSGWVLMTLVYNVLQMLSTELLKYPYFFAPFITPVLHAYFDVFSGFIQTTVFVFLTMLFISAEVPDDILEEATTVAI